MTRHNLVLGLGRFGGGLEACRALLRAGERVRVADRAPAAQLRDSVAALGDHRDLELCLGREDQRLLDGVDRLVINPAIRDDHPLLRAAAARDLPRTQELDLALEAFPGRVVLVTGTNGKSTTATLLAAALRRGGLPVILGGNIGQSLFALRGRWSSSCVAVVEASSFQLQRLASERAVEAAVLTRIGRDHLDWHGSLVAYHAAKARAAAAARAVLVHPADDPVAVAFPSPARRRAAYRDGPPADGEAGVVDGWLVTRFGAEQRWLHRDALRLVGAFHVENALAAAAAIALLGIGPQRAALALAQQPPLPHRLQQVALIGGVAVFDNGVSTELQSTLGAVRALGGAVRWVGGGVDKAGDPAATLAALRPLVESAHLFGAAAAALRAATAADPGVSCDERLEQAVARALRCARPGDRVLFSPAFASFDQYPNFRARARALHHWLQRQTDNAATTAPFGVAPPRATLR